MGWDLFGDLLANKRKVCLTRLIKVNFTNFKTVAECRLKNIR